MTRFEAGCLLQKITQRIFEVRELLENDYSLDPVQAARELKDELIDTVIEHISLAEQRKERERLNDC